MVKNKPLYKCKICKKKSAVLINPKNFKFFGFVQIFVVLVFVAAVLLGGNFLVLGFVFILVLFAGFYLATPFSVCLAHPKMWKEKQEKVEFAGSAKKTKGQDTATELYSN